MNKHLSLDKLIERLNKLRTRHGGDMLVAIEDSHSNYLIIKDAEFTTGSFDAIQLNYEI